MFLAPLSALGLVKKTLVFRQTLERLFRFGHGLSPKSDPLTSDAVSVSHREARGKRG